MKTGLLWNFNAGHVDQCQNLQKSVAILAFLPSECFQIAALVKALAHVVALNSFKSSSEARAAEPGGGAGGARAPPKFPTPKKCPFF